MFTVPPERLRWARNFVAFGFAHSVRVIGTQLVLQHVRGFARLANAVGSARSILNIVSCTGFRWAGPGMVFSKRGHVPCVTVQLLFAIAGK